MDEATDLNQLIRELNEGRPSSRARAAEAGSDSVRLDRWLEELSARSGSDLLLVAGAPPSVRVDGRLQPLAEPPLSGSPSRRYRERRSRRPSCSRSRLTRV
jgi:hypothetical protein